MENRKSISALLITAALIGSVTTYEHFVADAMIPVKGDVPTIGIGTTVYPDGTKVQLGDKIDRKTAEIYLKGDLDKFKVGMSKCIKAPLYQNEFEAMLSLTYNIGVSAFCNSSIPTKLTTGQHEAACRTILQFNKMKDYSKPKVVLPSGKVVWQYKVVRGLDNRRKSEYATCIGDFR